MCKDCKCDNNGKEKFYLSTAIAYASRKPHIGNTYEVILADAVARYKRLRGYDVYFLTGTDEHGQKIEDYAKEKGVSPKEYVDSVAGEIKAIWDRMNTTYSRFIRTTDEDHERVVSHIFKKLYDQGDIYKGAYEGWYCVPCESFYTDTQVENGRCPDCGAEVHRTKEEAYFFRMSAYQDRLLKYIEDHPDWIEPESRKKEMVNNFLKAGLQDLCVSRTSFKWGIPVSFDTKHVIYVWIDALSNYITGLGYDVDEQGELYSKYWPCDVHIIGKDIMRFHTIYWPIILMALGQPMPKKIFGHPWFLFGNDKMSKSKGNVLYADELADRFGVDAVRHYCLSEMPYNTDGNITMEAMVTRYNTDLANNLGNLVSRSVAMNEKYFGGIVPAPKNKEDVDSDLIAFSLDCIKRCEENMDSYHVSDAVAALFELFGRANKYIDQTSPWVLAKNESDKERLGTVIYNLLETIRLGASMLECFLPETAQKIFASLGCDSRELKFGALKAGTKVEKIDALFAIVDGEEIIKEFEEKKKAILAAKTEREAKSAPEKLPEISFDDFMAIELRAAKVLECEKVEKSEKLLKLKVDLGYEQRQIVSGIAKFYKPEDLIGKKVCIVANLKPAKLMGIESHGMLLASGEKDVKVAFLDDSVELGERVR